MKQSDISERTILQTLRENLRCTPYVMKSYKYSLRTIRPIDFVNIFYSLPKSYCSRSFSASLTRNFILDGSINHRSDHGLALDPEAMPTTF